MAWSWQRNFETNGREIASEKTEVRLRHLWSVLIKLVSESASRAFSVHFSMRHRSSFFYTSTLSSWFVSLVHASNELTKYHVVHETTDSNVGMLCHAVAEAESDASNDVLGEQRCFHTRTITSGLSSRAHAPKEASSFTSGNHGRIQAATQCSGYSAR